MKLLGVAKTVGVAVSASSSLETNGAHKRRLASALGAELYLRENHRLASGNSCILKTGNA